MMVGFFLARQPSLLYCHSQSGSIKRDTNFRGYPALDKNLAQFFCGISQACNLFPFR